MVDEWKYLEYYVSQSIIIEPGRMARLLDNLPSGIEKPQRISIGLVIHHRGQNPLEHGVPKERMREIHTSRLTELKNDLLNTPSISITPITTSNAGYYLLVVTFI
jgi:hypothetical protein